MVVLYKSYIISDKNVWVMRLAILIALNRFVWGVLDCWQTYYVWDQGSCYYMQNPTTGIGYSVGDILSDVFATLTAIVITFKRF
ncbi:hypothetical protein HDU98_009164, partial [Podochytrium sp. JEL0797]